MPNLAIANVLPADPATFSGCLSASGLPAGSRGRFAFLAVSRVAFALSLLAAAPGILNPMPTTNFAFSSRLIALIISETGDFPSWGKLFCEGPWARVDAEIKNEKHMGNSRLMEKMIWSLEKDLLS
jgi:hypothetical protein